MNRDYPLAESPNPKKEKRQERRQERKQEREGLKYEPKVTKGQVRRWSKYIK